MKLYDIVKITNMRDSYKKEIEFLTGTIIQPEIRDNCFYVAFEKGDDYIYENIKIEDLEIVKPYSTSDKDIFDELPKNDPRWWCKVEDGYIINLLGKKKNKIPYDYES